MKDKAQKNIKMHSVQFNFIMNAILTVSSFIFPLITFPYISRTLLVDGIGKVNFATSVISYFTMFASLGIPTYGIRACARVRDDREKLTKTAPTVFRPLSLRVRPYHSPGGLYVLRFRADSPVYPYLARAERSGSFTRSTTASAAPARSAA